MVGPTIIESLTDLEYVMGDAASILDYYPVSSNSNIGYGGEEKN
jgi:hypothetical protein